MLEMYLQLLFSERPFMFYMLSMILCIGFIATIGCVSYAIYVIWSLLRYVNNGKGE